MKGIMVDYMLKGLLDTFPGSMEVYKAPAVNQSSIKQ